MANEALGMIETKGLVALVQATDAMLKGTVKYLGEVLAGYVKGIRPEGVVNEPGEPRVPLRKS